MKKKLLIVDGNSIINRAFFAIPALTNKAGEYTNAVYGFLNIFFKFYDEDAPDCVTVAFDLPYPTFRHELYGDYKGTRKPMPDELRPQLPLLKNLLKKMNIDVKEQPGYEADDIIGSICARAKEAGVFCVVVSGDRDLLQLAGNSTLIRIPKTKSGKTETENYYAADVLQMTGVTPEEYIEAKALMGDASDNIPGVPGIGEKTAYKIIAEYKNIENAIENAAVIKPARASENLVKFAESARLSKILSVIKTDAPVEASFDTLTRRDIFNPDALAEVKRLGLKSFIPRFEQIDEPDGPEKPEGLKIISTAAEAGEYVRGLSERGGAAFCSAVVDGEFRGIGFHDDKGSAFISTGPDFDARTVINTCEPFFDSDYNKFTLDSKKEAAVLASHGARLNAVKFDASLAGYVLDSSKNSYNHDDLAFEFLGETVRSLSGLTGSGRAKKNAARPGVAEIASYAAKCAEVVYRTRPIMLDKLKGNGQETLYFDVELPLAAVLHDMEVRGIKVDRDALNDFNKKLDGEIAAVTEKIYAYAGETFNINSTGQLGAILFDKLMLRSGRKTKTGYSTDADVLDRLKKDYPIVPLILEYRMYAKLKSTYADGLLSVISPQTGRIHSTFNQTVTTTGRISSSEPNLQNIPVRLPLGRRLRKVFIPEDGFVFIDGDYSQIELRVLAHMSGDETLINAFREGQDIHRLTASQVFNTRYEDVTDAQRGGAKAVNFGIVYGIGAFSLSEDIGVTKKEAENYIEGYFAKYPGVKRFMDDAVKSASKLGYAITVFGRRRTIPELNDANFFRRAFGERAAMNMPVQGSAADIIKIAMINVHRRLTEAKLESRLVLQVHDELLLEAKASELETAKKILKEEMEHCVELSVPLETGQKVGGSWYDVK